MKLKYSYSKWNNLITKEKPYNRLPTNTEIKQAIANNYKLFTNDINIFIGKNNDYVEVKKGYNNNLSYNIYSDVYSLN